MERLLAVIGTPANHYRQRFLVKLGAKLLPVATAGIAYLLSVDGSTELYTQEGKRHLLDQPLDELEGQLDPVCFFRVNRQCIAHVEAIRAVHQHFQGKLKVELHPRTDTEVMVSREKARAFKNWLDGR
jgi:DNA-binding LytR/AlgR family response regulator